MSSLADLLTQRQPQFQTHQALIILGLQNEFISSNGRLPVSDTGFVDRIKSLVPKFRELAGDVIWVRSEFKAGRTVNDGSETGEKVIIDVEEQDGGKGVSPANESTSKDTAAATLPRSKKSRSKRKKALNMFKDMGKRKQPEAPEAPEAEATLIVQEEEELFLSGTIQGGPCCKAGTPGADFAQSIHDVLTPTDTVVVKSHYSAFKETPLLLALRTKLVTELYICGCMTNLSVYATALDAARYGITINIIEDCLGFRTVKRHETALKSMTEAMGAYTITSIEILADLHAPPEDRSARDTEDTGSLGDILGRLNLGDNSRTLSKSRSHDESIVGLAESLGAVSISSDKGKSKIIAQGAAHPLGPTGAESKDKGESSAITAKSLRSYRSQPDVSRGFVKTRIRVRPKADSKAAGSTQTESKQQVPVVPEEYQGGTSNGGSFPPSMDRQKQPQDSSELSTALTSAAPTLGSPPSAASQKHDKSVSFKSSSSQLDAEEEGKRSATRIKNSKSTPALKSPLSQPAPPGLKAGQPTASPANPSIVAEPSSSNASTPTMTKKKLQSLANLPILGPGDSIGEGDTYIKHNLLPDTRRDEINSSLSLSNTIFHALYHEVQWQKMYHAAGEVPRLVAVQGIVSKDGSMPIYRHPSDQAPPLHPYTKYVDVVRKECEKVVGHQLNHALIQLYRDGKDYISEHSDKTLDIVRGSSIVNASFGAQRTMRLRTKKSSSGAGAAQETEENQRITQRIPMPHNSIFVLGLNTNQMWLHSINADKRPAAERSDEEKAYNGMRISLTFRNIGTFLNKDEKEIWGQGAKGKTADNAGKVVNGDKEKTQKMIYAFGDENHQGEGFDWDKVYGDGFDVLHFRDSNEENKEE